MAEQRARARAAGGYMGDNYDISTLNWVKGEIDETLKQARLALDAFIENPEDTGQLQFCVSYLHQVWGTLQLVELSGAAEVVAEMERLARVLQGGLAASPEDALAVLIQAILQVPDYLEGLQAGQPDNPLVLLPLLNELRQARGEKAVGEEAFFRPDLSVVPEAPAVAIPADALRVLQKLRRYYQAALLNVLQGKEVGPSLKALGTVLDKLAALVRRPQLRQLVWVSGGLAEGLAEGGLPLDAKAKQLLGKMDQILKRLIENGEEDPDGHQLAELTRSLLFIIANCTSSGVRVSELQRAFRLGDLLPAAAVLEQRRDELRGVNAELKRTVSEDIREELCHLRDVLDIFSRGEQRAATELAPVGEGLARLANTLDMLEQRELSEPLRRQAEVLQQVVAGHLPADERVQMDVASAMVAVESALRNWGAADRIEHSDAEHSQEAEVEHQRNIRVAMKEAKEELLSVKDAITRYLSESAEKEQLQQATGALHRIAATLSLLSYQRAALVVKGCEYFIYNEVMHGRAVPEPESWERLADALTAVEYYLEAFIENRVHPARVLDVAERSLAELGYAVDGLPTADGWPQEAVELGASDEARRQDHEPAPVAVSPNPEEFVLQERAPDENPADGAERRVEREDLEPLLSAETAAPDGPTSATDASETGTGLVEEAGQEADDEIREIFIEEADEELKSIVRLLPLWQAEPGNEAALKDLRRAFHTIKGSGRLVGAAEIGEFAWAFENLLNRLLDHRIGPSESLFDLLAQAEPVLRELLQAFHQRIPAAVNTAPIEELAHLLAAGETGSEAPRSAEEVVAPVQEPERDPVLLEIYTNEAAGHLQVVEQFVEECPSAESHCQVSEALVRALHTLYGSSLTARLEEVAELAHALEKIVRLLQSGETAVGNEVLEALREGAAAIRLYLEHAFEGVEGEAVSLAARTTAANALLARLEERHTEQQPESAVASDAPSGDVSGENAAEQMRLLEELLEEEAEPGAATEEAEPAAEAIADRGPEDSTQVASADATDFDAELLACFLEEGSELLDAGEELLQGWSLEPDNPRFVEELQRNLHTFKGSARMAGIAVIGDLTHALESVLTKVVDGHLPVSRGMISLFQLAHDRLMAMLESVRGQEPLPSATDLLIGVEGLLRGERADAMREQAAGVSEQASEVEPKPSLQAQTALAPLTPEPPPLVEADAPEHVEPADEAGKAAERRSGSRVQQEMVRVRANLLDSLVNFGGEISIYRSRVEQQLGSFGFHLAELQQTVERLREQLRQFEIQTELQIQSRYEEQSASSSYEQFDPLEFDRFTQMQQLSRSMMESLNDLVSIETLLRNGTREAETLLLQQGRVNTELQENLMRMRTVPLVENAPRLRRVLRQVATELGKDAELRFQGAEFEMDRNIVERLLPVIEHLLRNAVAHGIELPSDREKAGKPSAGTVVIAMSREGSEGVIRISDDGRGIDLAAVRRKAREKGLLGAGVELDDEEATRLILESGISTAATVTQIAGRGVGMDIVNSEVKQLGGLVGIHSDPGRGTTFTIRVPMNLSVTRALVVQIGEDIYAVPLLSIQGLTRISDEEFEERLQSDTPRYRWLGQEYQLMYLGASLGIPRSRLASGQKRPLLFSRVGGHRVAIAVDGLTGSREIVAKALGPQLSGLVELAGATILGDGRVVLILDLPNLIRRAVARGELGSSTRAGADEGSAAAVPLVLVVDDSITVRRVTSRLLENNNMKAITARDGMEAVALLEEVIPDVVLLDIEMPRMDGYELAAHIRGSERLKNIPIIMITSRTGEKHRQRALDIGVDIYQGKPYQERDLLNNVKTMLARKSA